jgi:DNA-directed RNA polymerase specialized sigma subunit
MRGEDRYSYKLGGKKLVERGRTTVMSLDAKITEDGLTIMDTLGDGSDMALDAAEESDIEEFISTLKPRDKFIVLARMRGIPMKEIGVMLGVSESRISQLASAAGKRYEQRYLRDAA